MRNLPPPPSFFLLKRTTILALVLTAASFFFYNDLIGQTFCLTPATSQNTSMEGFVKSADSDDEYLLRIYIHRVRKSNGTDGLTDSEINEIYDILNTDYAIHGISFFWDCEIDDIDSDNYYNNINANIFNVNNHQNGIDLYLAGTNSNVNAGLANGVGSSSEFFVSGSFWGSPGVSLPISSVTSHEMGHVLNLWHTHHGVEFGGCEELVNGSNCETCGDLVCDTPPDPYLAFNVDFPDCEWNGSGTDSNGAPLNPDEKNIMSYTNVSCMEYFSIGQGERIRSSISTLPYLTDCVINASTVLNYTSGTTTIDESTIYHNDITIGDGATLIIDNTTVLFTEGVKVVVETGGTLIANSSLLTNAGGCDGTFWHGIRVEGNFYGNQQPNSSGEYEQGRVILDGSIIENAREGVATRAGYSGFATGGIIQANETSFLNCRRAIEFLYFENWQGNSSNVIPNVSYFKKCHFEWDDQYPGNLETDTQTSLVTLWKVDGVQFRGCTFESNGNVINGAKRAKAISGLDASVVIRGYCPSQVNPCPIDIINNEFLGFHEAIHLSNNGLSGSRIKESEFHNNLLGINLANANNTQIVLNEFIVGGHDYRIHNTEDALTDHTAIYSNLTNQFIIEDNIVSRANNSLADFTNGIVIESSGGSSNQIYNNDFSNLSSANIAVERNIEPFLHYGLKYLCNDNLGNKNDFEIRKGAETDLNYVGIDRNQDDGNTGQYPAGNIFSAPDTDPNNLVHLSFESNFHYYYKYNLNDPAQIPLQPQEVGITGDAMGAINLLSTSTANSCSSNYGPLVPVSFPQELTQEFNGGKDEFYDLLYTYSSLIDEGNTQGIIDQITLTWPQDAWLLRDELISRSPYNSETVLMQAGDRNILPHGMLLEVLLSNPDALQSGVVIKHIQYDIPNPLPQYMIDLLWLSRDERTLRSEMEAELRRKHSNMMKPHRKLINHYLTNLESFKLDSAIYWIGQNNNYQGKVNQASVKASQRNYSNSISILDSIPVLFKLNNFQIEEISTLKDLYSILENTYASNRTEMSLSQSEQDALYTIALDDAGVGSLNAAELLCFFYGNCLDNGNAPKSNRGKPVDKTKIEILEENMINSVRVYPNPADQYVAFNYKVLNSRETIEIRLYDQAGRQIKKWTRNGQNREQVIWDSRKFSSGVYVVELIQTNRVLDTQKIVLTH